MVCYRGYFGTVDLLTKWDWRATHWTESMMHLGFCKKNFLWSHVLLILSKRRHCCSQWEQKWKSILLACWLDNETLLWTGWGGKQLFLLGLREEFIPSGCSNEKKGKESFRSVVPPECIMSIEHELTAKSKRQVLRQARQYICAYSKIWLPMLAGTAYTIMKQTPSALRSLPPNQSTPRCCVLNFDTTFSSQHMSMISS
jgi:hypothetical protein